MRCQDARPLPPFISQLFNRIKDELNAMGVGTDDPLPGSDAVDYLNTLLERLNDYLKSQPTKGGKS